MKRLFVCLLGGVLLASNVSSLTIAAPAKDNLAARTISAAMPVSSNTEPTQTNLAAAIKSVKGKITIPEEYSVFDYYFNDSSIYSKAYWNLTWRTKDGDASIQVNCDEDFHITSYRKYLSSKEETGVSNYLKKELKAKADEFILKAAPETMGMLEYLNADYEGVYSGNYIYNYQRTNNGIALPDNTVKVWINSISGEVTALEVNWLYEGKVPNNSVKLSKEEAAKLIKENMKMKLVYRSNSHWLYGIKGEGTSKKAYLVYEPTRSYISVDAKTGEVYLSNSKWINTDEYSKESAATADVGRAAYELTQEELSKVQELKDLISKEKAISVITENKSLYFDKNMISYTANLYKQEGNDGKASYVWNISFNDPREIDAKNTADSYRGYAYASVDAKSGNILNYSASVKDYYDEKNQKWNTVKLQYDKKEAKAILEKFIKEQMSSRFKNTVFTEENDDYIAYYKKDTPVYGGYRYQYNRVNEGIEYPYNQIYGSVDAVTGKIYSFGSNWDENIEFEAPKGVISAEEAMNAYLSKDGFGLKYEINQINKINSEKQTEEYYDYAKLTSVEYEIRLVYRPDVTPSYISPFTGKQMNYDGTEYKNALPYAYKDITDEKKYRNIFLLSDMNIGFEGENFLPEQSITVAEINALLEKIGYGSYSTDKITGDNKLITREEIAGSFIQRLGLEKIAKLKGIYKTGYEDENLIDPQYLGSVALAKAYGLLDAEKENKFNPKGNISRYDAVNLLLHYIKVQRDGVLY
jgi:hypothetical protein